MVISLDKKYDLSLGMSMKEILDYFVVDTVETAL